MLSAPERSQESPSAPCPGVKRPAAPLCRPSPEAFAQGTLEAPPYPILSGMSRSRWAVLHVLRGAPALPRRAGWHAITLGQAWLAARALGGSVIQVMLQPWLGCNGR